MSLTNPDWNDRHDRFLFNQLFYNNKLERELTQQEKQFVKTMYHFEEYASRLDGYRDE